MFWHCHPWLLVFGRPLLKVWLEKWTKYLNVCSTISTLRYHLDNTQLHHLMSFHYTSNKMIIENLVLWLLGLSSSPVLPCLSVTVWGMAYPALYCWFFPEPDPGTWAWCSHSSPRYCSSLTEGSGAPSPCFLTSSSFFLPPKMINQNRALIIVLGFWWFTVLTLVFLLFSIWMTNLTGL